MQMGTAPAPATVMTLTHLSTAAPPQRLGNRVHRDEDGDGYGDIVDSGCCYSLILTDSYGDGWNGADLDLVVEQNIVESFENTDLNLDSGCWRLRGERGRGDSVSQMAPAFR